MILEIGIDIMIGLSIIVAGLGVYASIINCKGSMI